jgi:hypothetical protein
MMGGEYRHVTCPENPRNPVNPDSSQDAINIV